MVLNDSVPVSLLTVRMIMQGKVSLLSTCTPHPGERCGKLLLKKKKIMSNPIQFMQTGEMSGHLCLYVFASNIR